MKKITLLLFLIFISCDITYDGETRLISETNVIDRNGDPLSGIEVSIRASNGFDSHYVSKGVSDAKGNTTLVFLKPEASDLEISFSNEESGYEALSYNIKITDFDNYKHLLNEVILLKSNDVTFLEIHFLNTSNENILVEDYNIEGLVYRDYFMDEEFNDYYSNLFFRVAKNQLIQLHYTLRNFSTGIKSEHTTSIIVQNESINETINY